jgi:hypothetical protein
MIPPLTFGALAVFATAWLTSLPSAAQVTTQRFGDLVYQPKASPPTAEIYDLAAETWLDPVTLPAKETELTTAWVDADGFYLAYGTSVFRYDAEVSGEVFLLSTTSPVAGMQLRVTRLTDGYTLYGFPDGIVQQTEDVAPGESITFELEYHSPDSRLQPDPDFEIDLLYPDPEPAAFPGQATASLVSLRSQARVFEFDAAIGANYRIQYSSDLQTWSDSPTLVTAGANRVRWLDQGPPKTDGHPAECPNRYSRAVRLED